MHVLVLPLALSMNLSLPQALPNDGDAEAARADVARFVDLRALDLLSARRSEEMGPFPVVPLLQVLPPAAGAVGQIGRDEEWEPSEAAFSVFSELHGDSIMSAEFVEPGVLYMEATAGGHEAFARFVQRLEALHAAAPRIRVTRFAAEADQLAAARAAGGDAWRALALEGLETAREITLPASRLTHVRELQAHSATVGLDVEIAQGVAVGNPLVLDAAEGLDLTLLGSWSGDTLRLAYVARETEREDRDIIGPADTHLIVTSEGSGIDIHKGVGWYEPFGLTGGAAAGETALRTGDAMILSVRADHHLAIELLSTPPPTEAFAIGEGKSMLAVPRGAFAPARIDAAGNLLEAASTFEIGEGSKFESQEAPLRARLSWREGSALDVMHDRIGSPSRMDVPGATLLVFESENTQAVMDAAAFLLGDSPSVYTVEASWTDGDAGGSGTVEVLGGTQALLAVGSEGLLVKDYDVEVAQNAAIRDPQVILHFEGLACSIQVDRLGSGDLAFAVDGQVSRDHDLHENPMVRSIAATSAAITRLDERGTVAPSGDDSWRIVLGDESGRALRVELDVRKLR
ncbi:MAG: hypothetical protein VX460_06955 [Planctomycetota bacterium]|nr:hypothetical protein [Planctomycetota bacterium]